jgi:hypothetical protein
VARRWNRWWSFDADRPLLIASAPTDATVRRDKAFDLVDDPGEYVRVRRAQIESTHYVAEALPMLRVDIGPVATAAFLGAPLELSESAQTSWQEPVIESWNRPPALEIDPDNRWLSKVLGLLEAAAADAAGQYLVGTPDLTGAIDALSNMRGPERLCIDLFDHRDEVKAAAMRAVDAWERVFSAMYEIAVSAGTGITQWVTCWADGPFTVPTCDFNALIGNADFEDVCMPSLGEQARRAGLCVFHLDGPDAARHAETLADHPDITAIQYTPGAGTPSALAKLEMFRAIQSRSVPLFIDAPRDEVERLSGELDPRGLAIRVTGIGSPAEADALADLVARRAG